MARKNLWEAVMKDERLAWLMTREKDTSPNTGEHMISSWRGVYYSNKAVLTL
jgi:hypothetical protein